TFEDKGVTMVVDQLSVLYLDGTEIDFVEGLYGEGFKFNNPNVTSTCGCGQSFGV
ncbi:MAG: iron-sulfur cluster assembly accessory protein, partial [Deltaproteobacteria bacterium]